MEKFTNIFTLNRFMRDEIIGPLTTFNHTCQLFNKFRYGQFQLKWNGKCWQRIFEACNYECLRKIKCKTNFLPNEFKMDMWRVKCVGDKYFRNSRTLENNFVITINYVLMFSHGIIILIDYHDENSEMEDLTREIDPSLYKYF